MNIKITSDSTCDLSKELLEKNNITIIPLTVIKDDKAYTDGITITTDDIFAHVAAGGNLCTTTAVSVGEYQEWFAEQEAQMEAEVFTFTVRPGETIYDVEQNLVAVGYNATEVKQALGASYDFSFLND